MDTSSNEPTSGSESTGYTRGDDAFSKWRNFFSVLTGNMSPAGQAQYRLDRDIRMEAADCMRCEKQRDFLLQYSEP